MANHNNGILLVPAATETKPFAQCVWGKCSGVLFLRCRPHFCYVDGSRAKANSGCTIVLIAYGMDNFNILRQSGLGFPLIEAQPLVEAGAKRKGVCNCETLAITLNKGCPVHDKRIA